MSVTPPPLPPPPPPEEPDPGSRPPADPLNRAEEHSLAGLEDELRRSSPALETEMSALATAEPERPAGGGVDRFLQGLAIGVIVLVLLPGEWLAGVLSFGLLLGVPFAMAIVAARARREAATRTDADPDAGTTPDGGTGRTP